MERKKAKWYIGAAFSLLAALAGCSSASKSGLEARTNLTKIERVKGTVPQYRIDKFGDYPDEIYFSADMHFGKGQIGKSCWERVAYAMAGVNDVVETPFNALFGLFGEFGSADKYSKGFFNVMPGGRTFDRAVFCVDTDKWKYD